MVLVTWRWWPSPMLALVGLLAVTACASDSTNDPVEYREAIRASCAEFAGAWCKNEQACRSATFRNAYGDLSGCTERQTSACEGTRFAPGSVATPDQIVACARAIDLASTPTPLLGCADWLKWGVRRWPGQCPGTGTLADGAPCVDGVQCESGSCWGALPCGRCHRAAQVTEACFEDSDCEPGLACAGQSCADYGMVGADCSAAQPCSPELGCDGAKCVVRVDQRHDCKPGTDTCQLWPSELACDPATADCVRKRFRGYHEPCNAVDSCDVGLACAVDLNAKQPDANTGICLAVIEDGLVCAYGPYLSGGPCRPPAACAGQRCWFPDSASCSEALP